MLRNQYNRMGVDQYFEYDVRFKVIDSKSGSNVQPDTIKMNGQTISFSYSSGYVTLIAPISGMFSLEISKDGYNTLTESYSYKTLNNQTVSLTKIQVNLSLEVNITWNHGASVGRTDLDSYTYLYGEDGSQITHVYYSRKTYSDSHTSITLDRDDQGSNTGENTTIDPLYDGYKYHFYLYSYTSGDTRLADVAATAKLTYKNQTYTYTVPAGSVGRYWDICIVDKGELQIINEVKTSKPV